MRDSLFLMDRPSFLEGLSRVFDFANCLTQYNYSPTGGEADHAAIWADWELIARDFREAAGKMTGEYRSVKAKATRPEALSITG